MNKDDYFFKSIKIERFIINGKEIELPICYYRDTAMMGTFVASTKQINKILPTSRFKPVEILPSFALVSLIGLCHYDTSIGPFNELDIGIPVFFDTKFAFPFFSALSCHKNINFGTYMYRLFVSDEKALTAGIKVWNYPKVIADISFEETQSHRAMIVSKDNRIIIKFITRKQSNKKEEHSTVFNIFSIKDNKILKSPVNWRGVRFFSRGAHFAFFELGESKYASELSLLSLKNFCVEAAFYPDAQYILNQPIASYPI